MGVREKSTMPGWPGSNETVLKEGPFAPAAAVSLTPAAEAGSVYFEFKYRGPGLSAGGTVTTMPVVPDEYLMTGVSGQRNVAPITAFLYPASGAPGSLVYISTGSSVDNLLFEAQVNRSFSAWMGSNDTHGRFVDQTADGGFNPFTTNGLTYEYNLTAGGSDDSIPMQFPATEETPGPASLALAGANLAGLARLLRRRCWRGRAPARGQNSNAHSRKIS